MNYGELKTAIQNYVQSSESTFTGQLSDFIRSAEDRVYRSVQLPDHFKTTSDLSINSSSSKDLGAGVLEVYDALVREGSSGNWTTLLRKDYDFLREAYPDDTVSGLPKYYAISSASVSGSDPSLTIAWAPKSPSSCTLRVDYYGKVTTDSITSGTDSTTTWLRVSFPDVLIYGSLADAYAFMKSDPNLIQYYEQRFAESLATVTSVVTGEKNPAAGA